MTTKERRLERPPNSEELDVLCLKTAGLKILFSIEPDYKSGPAGLNEGRIFNPSEFRNLCCAVRISYIEKMGIKL
ncbi:MAG: hypothetical protein IPG01_04100 [Chitinophagaceae bacterium]|nr:hypothetical protein [Chitinophagaceae bacterium]